MGLTADLTTDSSHCNFLPSSTSQDTKSRPNIKNLGRSNLDNELQLKNQ